MDNTYLITGGTGLIGRAFIDSLPPSASVTVLSRDTERAKRLLGERVTVIDQLEPLDHLNDYQRVINLAGEPIADKRWSDTQKQRLRQSRFAITEQLVRLIQASNKPPECLISGSAIGYYGRQAAETPIDENWPTPHEEFSHTLCAQWESIAEQAAEKTRVCLLRTGVVLAPKGGALEKMLPSFQWGLGGPIGHGEQVMSWIHLDDMVKALHFLLETPRCQGAYNLTAPEPVSNRVFAKTLASALKRPAFFTVPAPVLKLIFGEMADLLLTGQRVIPARLQAEGFEFDHPQLTGALQAIVQAKRANKS